MIQSYLVTISGYPVEYPLQIAGIHKMDFRFTIIIDLENINYIDLELTLFNEAFKLIQNPEDYHFLQLTSYSKIPSFQHLEPTTISIDTRFNGNHTIYVSNYTPSTRFNGNYTTSTN